MDRIHPAPAQEELLPYDVLSLPRGSGHRFRRGWKAEGSVRYTSKGVDPFLFLEPNVVLTSSEADISVELGVCTWDVYEA